MFKEGGEKSFWESPSFTFMGSLLANPVDVSLLSRLKVIFLIFHTSLPPCSSLSHGCFGKSLKKGSPSAVCWANSFFPHWERITAFFGKCGCSPSVRCYFLSAEWAIFPCCFSYIWQSADEQQLDLHQNMKMIWIWKDKNNFICSWIVIRSGLYTEHPRRNKPTLGEHLWSFAAATLFLSSEVKILWVWLPISSPLRAWLPWPFSRGVPLSISKPTPYTEDSLHGREMGEPEWGKPLRRTFCWHRRLRLSSTFRIEEYAMQFQRGYGVYFDGHSVLWYTFGLTNVEPA